MPRNNSTEEQTNMYLGIIDPNKIVNKTIPVNVGDTFVVESLDCKGCQTYRWMPNFRTGNGVWNDFELLHSGLRSVCIIKAEDDKSINLKE